MANTALKGQPSGRFLGVNLRQDRVSIADDEVAKAINADLHSQPGTIVLRLGRTAQNVALADLIIRRLAKINGHRYRVAGRSLYCDATKVIDGLFSTNLITTMLPFRPFSDTTIWNFVADDAGMHKTDCTNAGTWGLPVPSEPTIRAGMPVSGAGGLTGVYVVQYTFTRLVDGAVAGEGNPSDASDSATLADDDLGVGDLEHPDDPTTNALGLYRSVAGSTVTLLDAYVDIPTADGLNFSVTHNWEVTMRSGAGAGISVDGLQIHWSVNLGTISVTGVDVLARGTQDWEPSGTGDGEDVDGFRGTSRWESTLAYVTTQALFWAYVSTQADTLLGDTIEIDNGVPPNASWVVNYQEHAFFCRDATNPSYLWFSKRFKPEQVPAENFLDIGNADDPLQCAVVIGGQLGVWSRKTKYRILGNITSGFVAVEAASPRGTPCPMATIGSEQGGLFVARDGIFSTFLSSQDVGFADQILPLFFGETRNDMLPFNWDLANLFTATVYKGRYYLSYVESGQTAPNRLAVYSRDTQKWYHYDHPLSALYTEEDTDLCLGGGQDGIVYILENGTTDGGASIALDVDTKDFQGESKDVRKLFLYLKVDVDTQGAALTVKLYLDDTLEYTTTVTTSARVEQRLPLPEGTMGHHWRVTFQYTGGTRIRIYSCTALYLPMMVA